MSEPKWTPGPWEVRYSKSGYPYQINAPNGNPGPGGITSVTRWGAISLPSSSEGLANAHLIAAAPDQNKRLQESTDLLQRLMDDEAIKDADRSETAVQIVYNRAALARARGEADG